MFLQKAIPVWAVLSCACCAATMAFAQEAPTEEELESARQRLQEALESGGLPPAAYDTDPVPAWAVPGHEPKVLPVPDMTAEPRDAAPPAERANTEVVDPNILTSQQEAEQNSETEKPSAEQEEKPKKPAVARKKETQKLKTGRAAAAGERKPAAKPGAPSPPPLSLPESLRP